MRRIEKDYEQKKWKGRNRGKNIRIDSLSKLNGIAAFISFDSSSIRLLGSRVQNTLWYVCIKMQQEVSCTSEI